MSKANETIADIVEELLSGEYAPLAARIEAAWKRQDEKICFVKRCLKMLDVELTRWSNGEKPVLSPTALLCPVLNAREALGEDVMAVPKMETATGNAAVMREALKAVDWWLFDMLTHCDRLIVGEIVRVPSISGFGILDKVRAALSDPPRNCDRFRTWEEAGKAWEEEGLHLPLIKWLFGTAKKGGAK